MQQDPKFIQYVDKPLSVKFDKFGNWYGEVISLNGYRRVCLNLASADANVKSFDVSFGKISGNTFSDDVIRNHPLDRKILCSDVMGPEMMILLHGTAGTTGKVLLWVYLIP